MRRLLTRTWVKMLLVVVCWGLAGAGGLAQGKGGAAEEPVARLHFIGSLAMNATTNGSVWKEIRALPATKALRDQTLDRLLAARLSRRSQINAPEATRLVRPLLDDFAQAEWYLELFSSGSGDGDWAVAIELREERARLWETNLARWQELTRPGGKDGGRSLFYTNMAPWMVVATRGAVAQGPNRMVQRIRNNARPSSALGSIWFKVDVDFARLGSWLPFPALSRLPRTEMTVTGRGEALRTEGRFLFAEEKDWQIEPWRVPRETVRDPLIGFTAIQGFGRWLSQRAVAQKISLNPAPNQLFVWGQGQVPFQISWACPASDPTNLLVKIERQLVPDLNTNLAKNALGAIGSLTNRHYLIWFGLPIIKPYLHPVAEASGGVLEGGLFPTLPSTNAAPAALFEQFEGRTNLLYYDWEVTQPRLDQFTPLGHIFSMVRHKPTLLTNSVAGRWLHTIQPRLGNTVTEVAVTSPKELSFVRRSHAGLTGFELVALARWVESTNFPAINPAEILRIDRPVVAPPPKTKPETKPDANQR